MRQKYYYIGWPECQRYTDCDPEGEHWEWDSGEMGIFVACEWADAVDEALARDL